VIGSCGPLPNPALVPFPNFPDKGLAHPMAYAVTVSDLPDMLVRETEPPGNLGNNTPKSRRFSKFSFYGCRIHGGYQLSESEHYSEPSMEVNKKTRLRVDAKDRLAIGRAFMVARIESGLTQIELAKLLGSSQGAIHRWEHGVNGAPVEAIKALARLISPASREVLFEAARIVDDTQGLLQPKAETGRIPLLTNSNQLGVADPDVDSYLTLPAHWLPEDANIKAAKFSNRISPIFGEELIALVDIRFRDPDRLLGCIVVARTPSGNAAMRLDRDGGTYFLVPIGDNEDRAPKVLQSEGDWSIQGKVIKWIGDAPAPVRK
jgi:transcriptional regulator with XRE-family HTH domain